MAIVRWEPFRDLSELNRLFATGGAQRRWLPAMDLTETTDEFVLTADLPGPRRGRRQDRARRPRPHRLRRAQARDARTSKAGYRRVERAFGSFSRSLTLPEGVDGEAISASFDRGVLEVRIPKPEQRKPRTISIAPQGARIEA